MIRREKAKSLNELAGIPDFDVFTKDEMLEFKKKLEQKFGSFDRKALNTFYDKGNIAQITWEQRMADGSVTSLPFGKVVMPYAQIEMLGKRIWKGYICRTNPFDFYEELYRQTCKLIARMEYGDKQRMKMYGEMATLEESYKISNE